MNHSDEPVSRAVKPGKKRRKLRKHSGKPISPTEGCAKTMQAQSEMGKAERFRRLSCQAKDDRLQQPEGEPTKNVLGASRELPE